MEFLRSRLIKDHTSATEVIEKDLPTNAISHIIISVDGYNVTDEATLAEIIAFINKVEVVRKGTAILSLESEDLYGLNCYLYKSQPILTNSITTDNATRSLSLIVPFGRKIFDPDECCPATKKGELTLYVDMTALGTSIDNGIVNIDTVELLDAQPTHFLKSTVSTFAAPGATGDFDMELPIGNELLAIQLRMVTFPATSSHTYGVDAVKILIDNTDALFASANAENLIGDMIFRSAGLPANMLLQQQILPLNTLWMDFDPNSDGKWALDTKGKSSVKLRMSMGVNEAVKVGLFERVGVTG